MTPWTTFTYSLDDYRFPEYVAAAIGEGDLTALSGVGPRWTWQTDQSSQWHRRFYAGFTRWREVYDRFVRIVVAPRVHEPFYYQATPSFRVHLPGNVAVGEFHTDERYHHPLGEDNFWVPLTDAAGTSSVWIADDDGVLRAVDAHPGQVVQFSAVTRRHGNVPNVTGRSRVSFDFRCLPVRCLPEVDGPPSRHARLRFIPGEYYAAQAVVP